MDSKLGGRKALELIKCIIFVVYLGVENRAKQKKSSQNT